MVDNSEDKGYVEIILKKTEDGLELCKKIVLRIEEENKEMSFYASFENGTIFVEFSGDDEKTIIGTYDTTPCRLIGTRVYAYPTKRLIGRIDSDGYIHFDRNGVVYENILDISDEECLAYYESGTIEACGGFSLIKLVGRIVGNKVGGAAAFIAIFYNFRIISIFHDFYCMDKNAFDEKYASYLHPYG